MNGKQVVAKLEAAGWTLARIEGSHHIMEKEGMLRPVPVPVHDKRDSARACSPPSNAKVESR
jgi:predicted RNA binding protein YcfA (HicA-like mRNA interferase family)